MLLVKPDVITLVHGTFAKEAEWVKTNSPLAHELMAALPNATIQTFQWSGDNSHHARRTAGFDLANQIKASKATHPESKHAIIAHSHGGNVALYALRDAEVRDAVVAIAFLSTPFFSCRLRALGVFRFLGTTGPWLLALFALPLFALILTNAISALFIDPANPLYTVLGFIWSMLLMIAFIFWFVAFDGLGRVRVFFTTTIVDRLSRIGKDYYDLVACPTPTCRWLSIYTSWDEALVLLKMLNLLSAIPNGASNLLAGSLPKMWPFVVAFVLLFTLAAGAIEGDSEYGFEIGFRNLFLPFLFGCGAAIAIYLLAFIVPPLVRGHKFGFGREGPLFNALLAVNPLVRPDGDRELGDEYFLRKTGPWPGLRHSASYTQPAAIGVIRDFLSGNRDPVRPVKNVAALYARVAKVAAVPVLLTSGLLLSLASYKEQSKTVAVLPTDRAGLILSSHRVLASIHQTIASGANIEVPIEVNQSFKTSHCHFSGTFKTDVRSVIVFMWVEDWHLLTQSQIDEWNSAKMLDARQKALLKQTSQASKRYILDNRYDLANRLSWAFDEHPTLTLDYTRRGTVSIGNFKSSSPATVDMQVFVDCFKD